MLNRGYRFASLFVLLMSPWAFGASALDGTTFQFSIENSPDDVGITRQSDTCESPFGTPNGGDDGPSDTCQFFDWGSDPVTLTFNGGPQAIGGLIVEPTVTEYAGADDGIEVLGFMNTFAVMQAYNNPGDIIEFKMRTADGSFMAANPLAYSGWNAEGIQYPNAAPDSEVTFFIEPEGNEPVAGNMTGVFFYYTDDGVPATDMEIMFDTGIAVGQHPLNPDIEVVYIFYSDGQMDEHVDTYLGGEMTFTGHTSTLDNDPNIGNLVLLASASGAISISPADILSDPGTFLPQAIGEASKYDGFVWGAHFGPPELVASFHECDLNEDGAIDAADAAIMFADWGANAGSIADKNGDGFVDASDAGAMFAAWTGDAPDAAAGDATAAYNVVTGLIEISANGVVNAFVESASGGLLPGNADAAPAGLLASDNASRVGLTGFGGINVTNWKSQNQAGLAADDLTLVVGPALGVPAVTHAAGSDNFTYIPEPASAGLLGLGLVGLLTLRRNV